MKDLRICVVGLGYVGLPLAVAFGKIMRVFGFDVNKKKIEDLKRGIDSMKELSSAALKEADIEYTSDPSVIKKANFIIVAVPTPITDAKVPDMCFVESASELVGRNLSKGSIVVYESTVYPGTTEEVCVPILERESKMRCGEDFNVGYSPERINPGDKEHTIDRIVKVVSGMDEETLDKVATAYGLIVKAGVFKAKSIRVAEAAKVIENIQRDLNIALMNELSLIFERMDIQTKDVLAAAGTKWNFHKYYPGLVGGHCIGVDPYYLTYKAQELGYEPQIILAGRAINERMAEHIANKVVVSLSKTDKPLKDCRALILGLTFKENVNDCRNSKARDVITELEKYSVDVVAYDPLLDGAEVKRTFGIENLGLEKVGKVDCVILVSPHEEYRKLTLKKLKDMMGKTPILMDIKGFYDRDEALSLGFIYDTL
jgi:UDP-N-acetyl-D-glucosamine/UDP-N-acetyl-D-galactosamine dehydrogenase